LSPDGKLLAIASSVGLFIYDAETQQEVSLMEADSQIENVGFSPDNQLVGQLACRMPFLDQVLFRSN
jgi:WD40 repeat protein